MASGGSWVGAFFYNSRYTKEIVTNLRNTNINIARSI